MPQTPLTSVEFLPQAVVVRVLAHTLGSNDVNGVCNGIDEAMVTAPTLPYILNMANVSYVPSVGLGVLVGLNQEFRNRGQRLIFAGLQSNVLESITVTYLNRMLEIVGDVPTALRSLGGTA